MSQILSSQGKNAPSNPYPHYLVRLATSWIKGVECLKPLDLQCFLAPVITGVNLHPLIKGVWVVKGFSVCKHPTFLCNDFGPFQAILGDLLGPFAGDFRQF